MFRVKRRCPWTIILHVVHSQWCHLPDLQRLFMMKNYWMYIVFMQGLGAEKHSVSPEAVEKCKEMFRDTAQDVGHPLTYLSDPQKAGNEEKIGCVRNVYGITEYDITPQAEAVLSGLVGVESARSILLSGRQRALDHLKKLSPAGSLQSKCESPLYNSLRVMNNLPDSRKTATR